MDGFSMFLRAKSLEIWWPFPGLHGETQEVLRRDSKKVSIYVYIYIYMYTYKYMYMYVYRMFRI
jgi:hypothetical protein